MQGDPVVFPPRSPYVTDNTSPGEGCLNQMGPMFFKSKPSMTKCLACRLARWHISGKCIGVDHLGSTESAFARQG